MGADGSFAITINDIPDNYKVCASTKDAVFILSIVILAAGYVTGSGTYRDLYAVLRRE